VRVSATGDQHRRGISGRQALLIIAGCAAFVLALLATLPDS